MTVKDYLEQYEKWKIEIIMNFELLQNLYDLWKPQTVAPTKPQNSHGLASLVVLEQIYKTEIDRLFKQISDLQLIINTLEDSLLRIILTKRYIELKKPENIAAEIPCDVRTVYRWLKEAINTLQAQYPDMFEPCE